MRGESRHRAVRMVVADLDGTLLNSNGELSDRTADSVRKVREQGILFTIATGRMRPSALRPLRGITPKLPIIALNGSFVANDDDVLVNATLPDEPVAKTLELLHNKPLTTVVIKGDDAFILERSRYNSEMLNNWIYEPAPIASFGDVSPDNVTELLVCGEKEKLEELASPGEEIWQNSVSQFLFPSIRHEPMWYYEIRHSEADKGSGLRHIRERIGLSKNEIIVFGDYSNDLPLFGEAGISVAMGNSTEDAKRAANIVLNESNDDDGVAGFISKFFGIG